MAATETVYQSPMLDYLERCVTRMSKESRCADHRPSLTLGSFLNSKFTREMCLDNADDFLSEWCRDMTVPHQSPDAIPFAIKPCPVLRSRRLLNAKKSTTRRTLDLSPASTIQPCKRRRDSPLKSRNKRLLVTSPSPSDNSQTASRILQRLSSSPQKSPSQPTPPKLSEEECLLPTIEGKISDVKSISAETMADVITGGLPVDADVTIVDCRYPYEYDGGHIRGAINLFTPAEVTERFFPTTDVTFDRRHVIIFHCEFSSERGPKMYRHLRQYDRNINADKYPALSYPHMYLLDSGYSAFFSSHKTLCDPEGYTSMFHADHKQDMRKFRVKSKSWPLVKSRRNDNADVRKTLLF